MNTLDTLPTPKRLPLMKARRAPWVLALCVAATSAASFAQVATVAPSTFSLNVASGGSFFATASPAPSKGTGDRVAVATVCGALTGGSGPGVSIDSPCSLGSVLGSVNVGAAINSAVAQTFGASFSPAQLGSVVASLAAAGQPYGSRRFFVVTQFTASALLPTSSTRFVTLQVNLVEPIAAGITQATASLLDIALNAPTPVAIRYTIAGTDTPLAGQFCTRLTGAYPSTGVTTGFPCAPATSLGAANPAMGFANAAQTGETLVVPETIARQAAQLALASGDGVFYFVRQFLSGRYAVVRLRLAGNAATAQIAFSEISLGFREAGGLQNIGFFKRGQVLPPVAAALRYQGSGLLRARWEVVMPGDIPPTALDLTAEASLTALERAQQHRYRVLGRVNIYLPATGQIMLGGPPPKLLPNEQYGQYLLLLRIEGSDTAAGPQTGIAPFVLPVLRYYIGESSGQAHSGKPAPEPINLVAPQAGYVLNKGGELVFQWLENEGVSLYRVEIEANGQQVYAARIRSNAREGINRYTAPPFIAEGLADKAVRWRVVALAGDGRFVGESEWRVIANLP